jgi:hypothetical protein
VLAQTLPVALLAALAILCGIATWLLHSRGQEEIEQAMDGIGRLRREAEVAIPARGLAHVFEEKLANARRAYLLQLWLGRTLFLVSLGLFADPGGIAAEQDSNGAGRLRRRIGSRAASRGA